MEFGFFSGEDDGQYNGVDLLEILKLIAMQDSLHWIRNSRLSLAASHFIEFFFKVMGCQYLFSLTPSNNYFYMSDTDIILHNQLKSNS